MGQRDVRKLLIIGAMSVISASERKGHCEDPWLARLLEKRPRMLVAVALANRMARRLWAMMDKERDYEIQIVAEPRSPDAGRTERTKISYGTRRS